MKPMYKRILTLPVKSIARTLMEICLSNDHKDISIENQKQCIRNIELITGSLSYKNKIHYVMNTIQNTQKSPQLQQDFVTGVVAGTIADLSLHKITIPHGALIHMAGLITEDTFSENSEERLK
jgi:hypothetical protein